ncbi:MAG: hypothetical protein ACOC2W_03025 [bacterium]
MNFQPYIKKMSKEYDVPANLINAVIYKENVMRNLSHSTKDAVGVMIKGDDSLGVCQIRMSTAGFLDLNIDPKEHASKNYKEREFQKSSSLLAQPDRTRYDYAIELSKPFTNIEYATKYLDYLRDARGGYPDKNTWLSDYNRGLTLEDPPNEYGKDYEATEKIVNTWLNGDE